MLDLSIIISTFQRPHLLRWNLKALSQQKIESTYEIRVYNDGLEDSTKEVCEQFSNILPIEYIFTGQRNTLSRLVWRNPGYVVNRAIKESTGRDIILTCAEMYIPPEPERLQQVQIMLNILNQGPKRVVITNGKDDVSGRYLESVNCSNGGYDVALYDDPCMRSLCTDYPFFMALRREEVIKLGGYEEAFFDGYCYEDTEFSRRLKQNGFEFHKFPASKIVHLFHLRARPNLENLSEKMEKNRLLYESLNGKLVANVGREWGVVI